MVGEGDPPPAPPAPPDPAEGYKKLLEKHGNDALRVAELLYGENHKHRETIRELKAKIPAEGAVVLAGDELKAFEALKGLGKTPAEIQKALYDNDEFTAADARRATVERHKEWAEVAGYDPDVLGKLLDDDEDIEIEVQEIPGPNGQPQKGRDGKPVRVAMVKGEDPKDKRKSLFTPLADYAAKNWPKFLPALKGGVVATPKQNGTPTPPAGPAPPGPPAAPNRLHGRGSPF